LRHIVIIIINWLIISSTTSFC